MIDFGKAVFEQPTWRVQDAIPLRAMVSADISMPSATAACPRDRFVLDLHLRSVVDAHSQNDVPRQLLANTMYDHVYGKIEYELSKVLDRLTHGDAHTAYQLVEQLLTEMKELT